MGTFLLICDGMAIYLLPKDSYTRNIPSSIIAGIKRSGSNEITQIFKLGLLFIFC